MRKILRQWFVHVRDSAGHAEHMCGATLQTRKQSSIGRRSVSTQALFGRGGGGAKTASKTAYICVDCGYIYDERPAFESLDKSYRCPVCSAPKRR